MRRKMADLERLQPRYGDAKKIEKTSAPIMMDRVLNEARSVL